LAVKEDPPSSAFGQRHAVAHTLLGITLPLARL